MCLKTLFLPVTNHKSMSITGGKIMTNKEYLTKNKVEPITKSPKTFSKYYEFIYKSDGLIKHIEKRHPDCIEYLDLLPQIIENPDFIGINPNEDVKSFELVKVINKNIQIGIKLDTKNNYLYVATLHTITDSRLKHRIKSGRLKKI